MVLAIRGATTVCKNSKDEILNATKEMVNEIILRNNLNTDDIISMCFTMTRDLDKVYPAVAVRELLGITDVALLNFEEKYIENSLKKCIRVMIHINCEKNKKDLVHVYLNEAKSLRLDIK